MKFSEIANRLTGISTPLVGVSWQPTDLEVSAARRVIAFLEDRRVLYAPDELEVPSHCVHSVLEIRHFLTGELGKLDKTSKFGRVAHRLSVYLTLTKWGCPIPSAPARGRLFVESAGLILRSEQRVGRRWCRGYPVRS